MGDTSNPRIWEGATIYVAPVGTARPTDVTTAWSGTWKDVGVLHDETGMIESSSETTNDYYAWGGILVRTTRSKEKRTIKFAMLEDTAVVFGLVNPGSVTWTSGGTTVRTVKVRNTDKRAFGIETTDGSTVRRRVIPSGEVIEVADISHGEDKMTMYEVTVSVYPDAHGVLWYDLSNDDQVESS